MGLGVSCQSSEKTEPDVVFSQSFTDSSLPTNSARSKILLMSVWRLLLERTTGRLKRIESCPTENIIRLYYLYFSSEYQDDGVLCQWASQQSGKVQSDLRGFSSAGQIEGYQTSAKLIQ